YYAKFVPNKSIACICRARFQTREHIIQSCLEYKKHRNIVRSVNEQLKLGVLLGTKDRLEVMANFLGKIRVFTKEGH
ncbi:hypothetical protein J132_05966, partial [Termitomyces sp. J132]